VTSAADRRGRASLPSVDLVLRHTGAVEMVARHGQRVLAEAVRAELARLRDFIAKDAPGPSVETVLAGAVDALERRRGPRLQRVINATGVVVHTNLGRAPLSEDAITAVIAACGYANVEYDLAVGARGSRTARVGSLLAELCGAEAGTAVNNGAAALLLAVAALASGREVIVSRGELVEIGGSFRLPEIIAAGGATLVEVGTTNRTRIEDYRRAIGPNTGLILKVHRSNFRLVGFTEEAELPELVAIAAEHDLAVVFDAGSGLIDATSVDVPGEPEVRAAVASGADVVLFSGDKLLGGPQAGLLAGSRSAIDRCRTSPLSRALRVDKLQIAALEATLLAHLRASVHWEIPVIAMLNADPEELRRRAGELAAALGQQGLAGGSAGVAIEVVPLSGVVGGGAAPGVPFASYGVRIRGPQATNLATRLREQDPPIVARVEDDSVLLDVRTIDPADESLVAESVLRCIAAGVDR